MSYLQVEKLHAAYGKKKVLEGLSFSAKKGEILACIGPNGAGKSTLLKALAGFLHTSYGEIRMDGLNITPLPPYERVKVGLAYFMQGGRVFPNLTVAENLDMGTVTLKGKQTGEGLEAVLNMFPGLKESLNKSAGLLSGGERQALALGMVLVRQPSLLLLDEPSAGLSPRFVNNLLEKVYAIRDLWGTSVILVEQNIHEAMKVADRALALVKGQIALETDRPMDWLANGQLETLFLGYSPKMMAPERAKT